MEPEYADVWESLKDFGIFLKPALTELRSLLKERGQQERQVTFFLLI